jgi:hypothetical protein
MKNVSPVFVSLFGRIKAEKVRSELRSTSFLIIFLRRRNKTLNLASYWCNKLPNGTKTSKKEHYPLFPEILTYNSGSL